ncbi:MAG TPA: AMP-binding protein, partial [Verrucomicrobiae bacterium]|nr:AMP-binding protein [Verrucomicrobiae bacterium]
MNTLIDLLQEFPSRGSATALVYRTGVRRFTCDYRTLHDRVLRTASLLQRMGLRPGDRVLLWGPNSPAWVAAFFGTMAAGGVAVPVDFMSARDRAQGIAAASRCSVLFQSRFKADRIEDGPRTLFLEELEGMLPGLPPAEPVHPAPDDPAEL